MSKGAKHSLTRIRDVAGTWGLAFVILVLGFVVAYQFAGPPPPNRIVLATGADGGAYQRYGEQFAAYLATEGIQVELRATAGSVENLALLNGGEADIGFVQGGLAESVAVDDVMAIGSLYLEPLWFFLRSDVTVDAMSDFAGKRIAVGAEGSGTRAVVLNLFSAHGVSSQTSEFVDVPPGELAGAFSRDEIDAAFIVGAPDSDQITNLIGLENVEPQSLHRADAYVRRFPYLSKVNLPQGVLDLQANLPESDISMVALTAMLAANKELHPALIDLLLLAATDINGKHSLLADAGQFPTKRYTDLPLSSDAARYFKYGPSFLMRYLPFWAATLIDRLWVMLLPLIGLAIPLFKLVPPTYQWQIRRRLLRVYTELALVDPLRNPVRDGEDLVARLKRLEEIDRQSVIQSVPKSYIVDIYKLRRDIDLIRRRLIDVSSPGK